MVVNITNSTFLLSFHNLLNYFPNLRYNILAYVGDKKTMELMEGIIKKGVWLPWLLERRPHFIILRFLLPLKQLIQQGTWTFTPVTFAQAFYSLPRLRPIGLQLVMRCSIVFAMSTNIYTDACCSHSVPWVQAIVSLV